MTTVKNIYDYIDTIAPFKSAMDFDNVGILVGSSNQSIEKVLLALDITKDVIKEAVNLNIDLIVSHHPVIFRPVKFLKSDDCTYLLAKNNICAICAHTNLDIAERGVNYWLAKSLLLDELTPMSSFGTVGTMKSPLQTKDFARYVKNQLTADGVRYTDIDKKIRRVAVCSGSGGDFVEEAVNCGADAFVTGEIKHSQILKANDLGLVIVDAGHFKTEDVVINPLLNDLKNKFSNVNFVKSKTCTDKIRYM